MFDSWGKKNQESFLEEQTKRVDTGAFPTGVYFLEITQKNGMISRQKWVREP
jgi:hypothetical protein